MHILGSLGGQDLTVSQADFPSLQIHERQETEAGPSKKRCPEMYVLFWNKHLPERKENLLSMARDLYFKPLTYPPPRPGSSLKISEKL